MFKEVFNRIKIIVGNFFFSIKENFQRLTRPSHASDTDLWDLSELMIRRLLPMILAFRKMEKNSIPMDFIEYSEKSWEWKSKDEYENAIKEGRIKGGGTEGWEKTIDEIIFAFEWYLYCRHRSAQGEDALKFYEKYGYKNPYAEIEENKSVSLNGEFVQYRNEQIVDEIEKRADKGFKIFFEYFLDFWD